MFDFHDVMLQILLKLEIVPTNHSYDANHDRNRLLCLHNLNRELPKVQYVVKGLGAISDYTTRSIACQLFIKKCRLFITNFFHDLVCEVYVSSLFERSK